MNGFRRILTSVDSYSGFYVFTVRKRDDQLVYETFKAPETLKTRKVLYDYDVKGLEVVSSTEYPILRKKL